MSGLLQQWTSDSRTLLSSATFRTMLTNATILVLGMGSSVQLSRWLGPGGRGNIAASMLWPVLLAYIVSTGLISAVMYYGAQAGTQLRHLTANAALLVLLQGAIGMAIGYVVMPWVLHSQSPNVVHTARLYLLVIPILLWNQYGWSLLQSRLHFVSYNALRLVIPAGYVLGVFFLKLWDSLTFERVVLLHLFLNVAALTCTIICILASRIPVGLRANWTLARKMFRYGFQVQPGDLSREANLRLDQVLMSAWMPSSLLGLYVVAVSASQLCDVVSLAWRIVATPSIARKEGTDERRLLLQKIFRKYLLISTPFVILLALTLPVLIPLFFGTSFRASVLPAEVLLIGAACLSAKNVLGGGLQAMGSPWLASRADLIALVVTVATLPPLLFRFGILGAAVASTLAYATQLLCVLYGLNKGHSISMRSLLYVTKAPPEAVYR